MLFTNLQLKSLRPKKSAFYLREKGVNKGFCVKVHPSGNKVFYMAYMLKGKERFFRLGAFPQISLSDARDLHSDARALVDRNIDPQKQAAEERAKLEADERAERQRGSVKQLFELYIDYLKVEKTEASARQVQQSYNKDMVVILNPDMKAKDVTPNHIKLIIHRVAARGALVQSNRVRSYLMSAFKHGIEYDHNPMNLKADVLFSLDRNPVRDIPRVVKQERVGNRDLSGAEVGKFWRSLSSYEGMDYQTSVAFKMILATGGLRVQEVVGGRWSEIDIDRKVWEFPSERTKNRKPHVLPLGEMALSLLEELRTLTGLGEYLFPKKGDGTDHMPLATMSKALARYCERTGFDKFTPRDLRRTCKSRMGEIGLSKEIRDRLHNHALNDVSSKHYDRYDYLKEKTHALNAWNSSLSGLIAGAEVVPIKRVGKRKGGALC